MILVASEANLYNFEETMNKIKILQLIADIIKNGFKHAKCYKIKYLHLHTCIY